MKSLRLKKKRDILQVHLKRRLIRSRGESARVWRWRDSSGRQGHADPQQYRPRGSCRPDSRHHPPEKVIRSSNPGPDERKKSAAIGSLRW